LSGVQQSTVSEPPETLQRARSRAGTYAAIATFLGVCTVALFFLGTYKSILQEYVVPKDHAPAPTYLLRQNENRLCLLRIFCRTGITLGSPRVHGDVKFESTPERELDWMLSDNGLLLHQTRDGGNAPTKASPISPADLMVSAGYRGDDAQLKRMVQDFEHVLNLIRDRGPYSQTYTFDTDDVAKETGLNELVPLNPKPLFALRSNEITESLLPPFALGALGCLCASLWCYFKSRGVLPAKSEVQSGV
jgi:hypothetical protein